MCVCVRALHMMYAFIGASVIISASVINPQRACASVTVIVLCVCVCVCVCLCVRFLYSAFSGLVPAATAQKMQ